MKKVLVLGGTGFVGKNLCSALVSAGYQVFVLTRNLTKARQVLGNNIKTLVWHGPQSLTPSAALPETEYIINLAGESIGEGRWTRQKKKRILDSRVNTTRTVVNAIKNKTLKPSLLINASAVGFYGPHGDEQLTEDTPAGQDFLARVCRAWESEAYEARALGVNVITLRIGMVLGKNGGALDKMQLPFKFYMGGPLGTGDQWLSWIHLEDLTGSIIYILENGNITGPVNTTAPHPVTMREFCRTLGKVMGKPSWLQVPTTVLRLALGEQADMLLNGQRVIPAKLQDAGYTFKFPTLNQALENIIIN